MKKLLFENFGLKIIAVFLAIALWMFATSSGQSEISIDVPVEFKNIPAGLELVNFSTKSVTLHIRGQERIIRNVKPSDIPPIGIDLSNAKKGESLYYINRENIKLPPAVSISNISPSSIKIITEETRTKTVRVKPVIVGTPEKGYNIESIDVVPSTITIEGINSELNKINILKTEPLDVSGLSNSVTQELRLDLAGRNVRTRIDTVNVKVVIGARGH
jgi:YbbR domain-containing protein